MMKQVKMIKLVIIMYRSVYLELRIVASTASMLEEPTREDEEPILIKSFALMS